MIHARVSRQLRRHLGTPNIPTDLIPLLEGISAAFVDVDRERALISSTMDALSVEMLERLERVRQSEARYRQLFEALPLPAIVVGSDGESILAWNAAATTTFGWQPDEAMRVGVIAALSIDGAATPQWKAALTADEPMEARLYARGGRAVDAQLIAHAMPTDSADARLVIVRDVTAERAAERARRNVDARYRSIFRHAGVTIMLLDLEGVIEEVNATVTELLGYTPAELVGRGSGSLSPADESRVTREPVQQLKAGLRDAFTVEKRLTHKNGTEVWVQLTVSVIELDGVRKLSAILQDITARKTMEAQLLRQAFSDDLTGMANRALFRDRLRHALDRRARTGAVAGVLLLDFDGFKRVNDSLGHAAGDELLVAAAKRLSTCVRSDDTVARLGGDEFAILVEEDATVDRLAGMAERILDALRDPILVPSASREVVIGASLGLAIASDEDDDETVLRNADTAMYAAKAAGRRQWRRFDPDMHRSAVEWLELESDLRLAVDQEALTLAYQPIVALTNGELRGVEALLRWSHPTRGIVAPDRFIPIAEEAGLIIPLGRWVLRHACRQVSEWARMLGRDLSLSVNVAARQFESATIVDDVRVALEASGLPPRDLVLELTESDLIRFPGPVVERLQALRALGVRISIDDFGTGYSSLAQLQAFPVDEIKIDRRFVAQMQRDERDLAFVDAILALGRSLSVEVVAEGIELSAQQHLLTKQGCHLGQGYLFGRPLAPEGMRALLLASRTARFAPAA
jgi:diguanylate cyclase (GGDEF)-like protein/PAS domain S-box-containing protein